MEFKKCFSLQFKWFPDSYGLFKISSLILDDVQLDVKPTFIKLGFLYNLNTGNAAPDGAKSSNIIACKCT